MLDLLLSISGLTILFSSTWTSWSTSLNLLFFYLTWSTLVFSQAPLRIELLGTFVTRILFFWVPTVLMFLLDTLVPSIARKLKTKRDGLPKLDLRSLKTGAVAMGNMVLGVGIQGAIEWVLVEVCGWRSAIKVTSTMPLPATIAWDLLRGILVREVSAFPPLLSTV